ncbi:Peroxidase [Rhynchospora pubera]|uniref:Peroxidase n=1 Tax=Rhynchospora pubera TaxID=906938 RepID=A0AAV8FNE8_9POAL|nr:Peroxidase [Rhynchospora pubera]
MKKPQLVLLASLLAILCSGATALNETYYANICPNLESLVQGAVRGMMSTTNIAAAATLRLFFHDCIVQGCDASILIQNPNGDDEQHNFDNQFLRADGYRTVLAAKAAVDADPQCTNKVSCADIIALAARDAVFLSGGPTWKVELGRFDGKISTASSVDLPGASDNYDKLMSRFSVHNLTPTDMVALSGAHTLGATSCFHVNPRLYPTIDPNLDPGFASQLQGQCPAALNVNSFVFFDNTVITFDNDYFKQLQQKKGVLSSDEILYVDSRSQSIVDKFAANQADFFTAFVDAMKKLGRIDVKTAADGEIRKDCRFTN